MFVLLQAVFSSPWTCRLVRLALAAVFVYAGTVKLMDPKAFARVIYEYGLVPNVFLVPVAIGLPLLEVLAGIGLVFDVRGSLEAIFGMLALFIAVLGYGMFFRLEVDCGCFSAGELQAQQSLKQAFYRDWVMMAGVAFLYFRRRSMKAASRAEPCESLLPSLER